MEQKKARYIYCKRAVGNFAIYNTGLGGQSEVTLWTAEGRGWMSTCMTGYGCQDDRDQKTNISTWLEPILCRYPDEPEPNVETDTNICSFIF